VRFVRKRDPRYKLHLSQMSQTTRAPVMRSEAPQRNTQIYIEQEWQKVDTRTLDGDLGWAAAEGCDREEWICVICNKVFRSEAAWDSHERSKKVRYHNTVRMLFIIILQHMKELEMLKKSMQDENEELDLTTEQPMNSGSPPPQENPLTETGCFPTSEALGGRETDASHIEGTPPDEESVKEEVTNRPAPQDNIRKRGKSKKFKATSHVLDDAQDCAAEEHVSTKRERRKAREQRKKEEAHLQASLWPFLSPIHNQIIWIPAMQRVYGDI
jgi:DnaJ family protein A protein 5